MSELIKYFEMFKVADAQSFSLFGFHTFQRINSMDYDILRIGEQIITSFLQSGETRNTFLANVNDGLRCSLEFILRILYSICKHGETEQPKLLRDFFDLLADILTGLLSEEIKGTILKTGQIWQLLHMLLNGNFDEDSKCSGCVVVEILLKLIVANKAYDDSNSLSETIMAVFSFHVLTDTSYMQICNVCTIYLKGIGMKLFANIDILWTWLESECIPAVTLDNEERVLIHTIRCLRTFCECSVYSQLLPIFSKELIKKLDVLCQLCNVQLLKLDAIHVTSYVLVHFGKTVDISLERISTVKDLEVFITKPERCQNNLIFIILYLEYLHSNLSLSKIQINRLISTKINGMIDSDTTLLRCIFLLYTIQEKENYYTEECDKSMLRLLSKENDLESVVTYDVAQLNWILLKSEDVKNIKVNLLILWLKNKSINIEVIKNAIKLPDCTGLLIECLHTNVKDRAGEIIRELNDPTLFAKLCSFIPTAFKSPSLLVTVLNAGAALPNNVTIAHTYVRMFHALVDNISVRNKNLCAILPYVLKLLHMYRMNLAIMTEFSNTVTMQNLLLIASRTNNDETAVQCIKILQLILHMQDVHNIKCTPLDVDLKPLLTTNNSKKYDHVLHFLMKVLLQCEEENRILLLKEDEDDDLILGLLDCLTNFPPDVNIKLLYRILTRLIRFKKFMYIAFLPSFSWFITSRCRPEFDMYIVSLLRLIQAWFFAFERKSCSLRMLPHTKRSLIKFAERVKDQKDTEFILRIFK